MCMWEWLGPILGAVVVLATLVDVALTVLHTDLNGPIGDNLHRAIWRGTVAASRRVPRFRRGLLGLAGPVMMLAMFAAWAGLYIVGFALIVWPHLELYRTGSGQEAVSFVDALYYSGITATVLGYGDISPRTGWLQVMAVVESGLGFAMFSGVVTWLINVVSGVSERDALALRTRQATGGTHDGVRLVEHYGSADDPSPASARMGDLAQALQQLQPKMRQFPVLDLHYRSNDASLAPEKMVRSLAQAALAGYVLAARHPGRLLEHGAGDLDRAVTDLMTLVAQQHLPRAVSHAMKHPQPREQDEAAVRRIRDRLQPDQRGGPLPPAALLLACRLRLWLDAMDRLTAWRMDDD